MTTNLPAELTAKEIAARIDRHLKRMEAQDNKDRARKGTRDTKDEPDYRRLFWANAQAVNGRVHVLYVSYQGASRLTKREAAHYLAGLDAGYEGTHHTFFHHNPLPAEPDPEIRFRAIIRHDKRYALYGVTKRTEKRVYGKHLRGGWYGGTPSYVDRDSVVRWQGTAETVDALNHEMQAAEADVAEYRKRRNAERDERVAAILEDVPPTS